MPEEMKERPGYRKITIPQGPQKGKQILRLGWPEQHELRKLKKLGDASTTEEDTGEGIGAATLDMYRMMAQFIPQWTLVDRLGQDLPQPEDDPSVFDRLDSKTLTWFVPVGQDSLWSDVLPNVR